MQEEKLKKGNNKVLLISIIAVIAVLFLSASVYLVLRGMGSEINSEEVVKDEVGEEVIVKKEKINNGYLAESDSEEENDYSTFCSKWKDIEFATINKEAGSVDVTGTIITKLENAPFVENEKVTNVYFVVSKLEIEDENQQLFYNYYMKKVKNGNAINDVDGENLLFKLGIIEEEKLISTSEISDNLKSQIISIANTGDSINLRLTIPVYEGGGAPASFSFACEIVEGVKIESIEEMDEQSMNWESLPDSKYGYRMGEEKYAYILAKREAYCPVDSFKVCAEELDEYLLRARDILLKENEIIIDLMSAPSGFCPGNGLCNPLVYSVLDIDLWKNKDPNAYHIYMQSDTDGRIELDDKFDNSPLVFLDNGEVEVYELLDATTYRDEGTKELGENYFFQKHKRRVGKLNKDISVYNLLKVNDNYSFDKVFEADYVYKLGIDIIVFEGGYFDNYFLIENCMEQKDNICVKNTWNLFNLNTQEIIELYLSEDKNMIWVPSGFDVDINNKKFVLYGKVYDFSDGNYDEREIFGEFGVIMKDYKEKNIELPLLDNIDKGLNYNLNIPYDDLLDNEISFIYQG